MYIIDITSVIVHLISYVRDFSLLLSILYMYNRIETDSVFRFNTNTTEDRVILSINGNM